MAGVGRWGVAEVRMQAAGEIPADGPMPWVMVEWTGPDGCTHAAKAFWDGGREWVARFSPGQVGVWCWRVTGGAAEGLGLAGRSGEVMCVAGGSLTRFGEHGPLRVAPSRTYFEHEDGTPFLWLADTAWNGLLKAREEDWEQYLAQRAEQGFTAVQVVMTNWRSLPQDAWGERAYGDGGAFRPNPDFFRQLDAKFAAINRHGLLAVPVMLWAIAASGEHNPGYHLREEDAVTLARYIQARYGAYHLAWMLGGDGDYRGDAVGRWRRIGRQVFDAPERRLVTMHPAGLAWTGAQFRGEPWFDFIGYQSGHGDAEEDLRWLTSGPPAQDWGTEPVVPIVNLEPNYEGHVSYHSKRVFGGSEVRRGLWWSLLASPTAGVTYGQNGVWPWMEEAGLPPDHAHAGVAPSWRDVLDTGGAHAVTVVAQLLAGVPWWRLRPAQGALAEQPGEAQAEAHIAAATVDGSMLLAYSPLGQDVVLAPGRSPGGVGLWLCPRTGAEMAAAGEAEGEKWRFCCPSAEDWLLLLRV